MTSLPSKLRVALIQCAIVDLDVERNLNEIEHKVADLATQADLVIFPEAITTGFSREAMLCADTWAEGIVCRRLCTLSQRYGIGLAGSYFSEDKGQLRNRFFLIDGDLLQWQDKRHLFSLGGEPEQITPSSERKVLLFRSWRVLPLVCYDLRFPVWSRCVQNDYDMIICVANWPQARREVWMTLLRARAMENLAYTLGVNRVGKDKSGLSYVGDSLAYNPRGEAIGSCHSAEAMDCIVTIEYEELSQLRSKFPVWQDADTFTIN